jgi:TetR/AcrR family transcriptional regulator of autoinduction and epiphytic fitness
LSIVDITARRVDGRTARSERTRKAIIDAYLRLVVEGDLRPTGDRIAKAAGTSLRALWSHFPDMEALLAVAAQRVLEQRDAAHQPILAALPLVRRIDAFCTQRARILEEFASTTRAAAVREPFSPALQRYHRIHLDRERQELRSLFAAELGDDSDRLTALVAASTGATWEVLRTALELEPPAAAAAMRLTVTALLT